MNINKIKFLDYEDFLKELTENSDIEVSHLLLYTK